MISASPPPASARFQPMGRPQGYAYLRALPDDYANSDSDLWPLILFLHGSAFRGDDLASVGTHGLPRLLNGGSDLTPAEATVATTLSRRFIVVAPQCPHYEVWDDAQLLTLLDEVGEELRVDPTRVYLTGLSMGGFGAWSLGMRHPERFAAIAPVCGGGRVADLVAARSRQPEALRRLGVWAFHGGQDNVVPVEESQRMIAALQDAGAPDVKLTVYPEAQHDAWSAAYATPELYRWLLQRHGRA